MTAGRTNPVIQHLRQAALAHESGGPTDGELLGRFVARRDAAALEALIRRHGPMVLAVCRRVLAHEQDAEDAFQAAFLVFVRKAASIRSRELIGNWLYGVAYRTALKARGAAARRRMKEKRAADMTPTRTEPEARLDDLLPLLDQELNRLPDKYRTAIVLCELEGRSRKEAARQLGVPEGTLSSRLATGRRMLTKRLGRRGLGLSAAALAALVHRTASAALPAPLLASTVRAAALAAAGQAAAVVSARVVALSEGVLKAMLLAKLSAAAFLAAVALVAAGSVACVWRVAAGEPNPPAGSPRAAPPSAAKGDKAEAADDGTSEWGEAVDGVQARIRSQRRVWEEGVAPTLHLDLRNKGEQTPNARRAPVDCQIEVDGTWYSYEIPSGPYPSVGDLLEPGKQVNDWAVVTPDEHWTTIKGKKEIFSLSKGKHSLRIGYWLQGVTPNIRPVSGPLQIEVVKAPDWGEAVGGVQARLRPDRSAWDEGETPLFFLDMRNRGERNPFQCRVPNFCEIEWDGLWYKFGGSGQLDCKSFLLKPDMQIDEWSKVSLDVPWVRTEPGDKEERLQVTPGKHTVRVAFVFEHGDLPDVEKEVGAKPIRPVSQPAEIVVGKESAWGESDKGVQGRIRTAKAVWADGETPTFLLDLRNQGKQTPAADRMPFACRVEADGVWYEYGRPISWVGPDKPTRLEPGSQINEWVTVSPDDGWRDKAAPLSLPPGRHTVRLALDLSLDEKTSIHVASAPVEIEVVKGPDWGEAADGVQARLRPYKAARGGDEAPKFALDLRNRGDKSHGGCRARASCEIEWDGQWYSYAGPKELSCIPFLLDPGKQAADWMKLSLADAWVRTPQGRQDGAKDEPLKATPGRHTVRAAFRFTDGERPVTRPVEIEIMEK